MTASSIAIRSRLRTTVGHLGPLRDVPRLPRPAPAPPAVDRRRGPVRRRPPGCRPRSAGVACSGSRPTGRPARLTARPTVAPRRLRLSRPNAATASASATTPSTIPPATIIGSTARPTGGSAVPAAARRPARPRASSAPARAASPGTARARRSRPGRTRRRRPTAGAAPPPRRCRRRPPPNTPSVGGGDDGEHDAVGPQCARRAAVGRASGFVRRRVEHDQPRVVGLARQLRDGEVQRRRRSAVRPAA